MSSKRVVAAVIAVVVLILGSLLLFRSKPAKVVPVEPVVLKSHKVLGKSVEGRVIEEYKYGNGTTTLAFVGGIHGGYEWNSVLLAYNFIDYLDVHPEFVPVGATIVVIPSLNPDGVFKVTGKEGRFAISDVSTSTAVQESGRFNANKVDLNRNFDCKWQAKSTWKNKKVSAGSQVFSEPESKVFRQFITTEQPTAVVFWHSQANAVYASQCGKGILPDTLGIMNAYATAAGYPAVKEFSAYVTTGAAEDWLASIGVPAITVELKTHETIEWPQNLLGIKAVMEYYRH